MGSLQGNWTKPTPPKYNVKDFENLGVFENPHQLLLILKVGPSNGQSIVTRYDKKTRGKELGIIYSKTAR